MKKNDEYQNLIEQIKGHFRTNRLKQVSAPRDIQLKIGDNMYMLTAGELKFIVLRFAEPSGQSPDFKFHINVSPEDLETAWAITAATCAQKQYSGMKVFSTEPEGDLEQQKKPITVYTKPKNLDKDHMELLRIIEQKFKEAGIKPLPEDQLSNFDAKLFDDKNIPLRFVTYRREDPRRRSHYVPTQNDRFSEYYRVSDVIIADSDEGRIPLHYAVANGVSSIIQKIIKEFHAKNSVRTPDDKGQIPLHIAVHRQQLDAVQQLLSVNSLSQVNCIDHLGCSALHYAANSTKGILHALLSVQGVNIELRNYQDKTPLMLAVQHHNWETIELLLSAGAQANPHFSWVPTSVYHQACLDNKSDLVEKNLSNSDIQDERGRTFLHYAAEGGHDDLISMILKIKPQILCKDIDGMLPLHIAAQRCTGETLKLLMQPQADEMVNIQDAMGKTPLHHAVAHGNHDAILALLRNSKCIFLRDGQGRTAFHEAAKNKHRSFIKTLLEAVKDETNKFNFINQRDREGKTPLHYAAESGNIKLAKYLIKHNADLKAVDNHKKLPWHYVKSNDELIILLGGTVSQKETSVNKKDESPIGKKAPPATYKLSFTKDSNVAKFTQENTSEEVNEIDPKSFMKP